MNEVLEDLEAELGFELTTIENLIGHFQANLIVDAEANEKWIEIDGLKHNVRYLEGKRDMILTTLQMIEERKE